MKVSNWVRLVAFLCVVGIVSAVGYHLYQRHLSGDVKRLLLAANDEHATMQEVHQYMAQVRPLERTQRDHEVAGELEDGLALYATVQEDQQKDEEEFQSSMRHIGFTDDEEDECFGNFNKLAHISQRYQQEGMAAPKSLREDMQEALTHSKECLDRRKQASDARTVEEKNDRKQASQKFNDVRKAIGVAPIPTS